MYRNIDEVVEALATRLPQTEISYLEATGYGYVPWEKSTRLLDSIFGPFGWEHAIVDRQSDTANGIYSATVRITVHAWNPATSTVLTTSRDGVGVGLINGTHANAHDTAIKGAASDGFSRAVKMLGDAFGLFLYDRDDPARKQATAARPATNNAASGNQPVRSGGASEKQITHLTKNGISLAQATKITGKQASDILNLVWDKTTPLAGPVAYERVVNGRELVGATNGRASNTNTTGDDFNF